MKIQILKKMPTIVASDKELKKAFIFWSILKSHYTDGNVTATYGELSSITSLSTRTVRRRLEYLQVQGYLSYSTAGSMVEASLQSYDTIAKRYNIDKRFYHTTHTTASNTEYYCDARVIYEYKKKCQHAWQNKIDRSGIKEEIKSITGLPFITAEALTVHQVVGFIDNVYSTDDRQLLELVRADFNVGSKKLSQAFGFTSRGAMAYKKRKLQSLKLITVEKRIAEVQCKGRKNSTRETSIGEVSYFRPLKNLALILPDNIIIH